MTDRGVASSDYSFGPFRLLPSRQLLLEDDRPLRLGTRALDILTTLVERAGETVSKEELIARVWPNTFVDEANLRVHVAAIRKILGDGRAGNRYVANVPGRGYCFVAPISIARGSSPAAPRVVAVEPTHNLPVPLTRMVGRAEIVEAIVAQLPHQRLITLVGAGGIGKTTVALALAEALLASYGEGVRFIDLAPLSDPHLVPSAVASVLGVASDNPVAALISFLRNKRILLVLDGCEHVVEATAALTAELLKGVEGLHILATSREPLRAEGEHVHRLSSLDFPPASAVLTAAEALTFSAVQLFVERAGASSDAFELSDENASIVGEICRRLDGIALAVELAATRLDAFGVRDLAARLDDRFRLLARGRRAALPRQRTLGATLDWSYEFLPETERVIWRRLAVLARSFSLDEACAVASGADITAVEVIEGVANLVAKSLVVADIGGAIVHYHLLETMRAYALAKLAESGELNEVARRHSEYFRDLFERALAEWETRPTADWLEDYGRKIDNVRAALDWAFSPNGDTSLGVSLTVAAVPLWFQLSLINECRGRVERALATLKPGSSRSERREMQLYAALGWSLMYTTALERETDAFRTALALAERLDDTDYQLRALWGLWSGHVNNCEFEETLALARRFRSLAASAPDPADVLVGDRMIGASLHFLGDQAGARQHIERMLKSYVTPTRRSDAVRFRFDQRVTARITLARALWLQGFADQAMSHVESNIERALSIDHTLSLCNALALAACPIALLAGKLSAADRFIAMLLHHAEKHGLDVWHAYGRCFKGELLLQQDDYVGGLQLLRAAVDELREAGSVQYHTAFLRALAQGFAAAGLVEPGITAIDEALAQSERNEERWCVAELLRIKGDLVLLEGGPKAVDAAEELFAKSLAWARRQQTLSWELRTVTSLARLRRDEGRIEEARDLLGPVYARFSEGFGTQDLKTAKTLLDQLA